MRIALDFDDTITRDPQFWMDFVGDAFDRGHEIRIVTFRHEAYNNGDIESFTGELFTRGVLCPVIYTNGERKRYAAGVAGYFPDVWIDDVPELIGMENRD